MAIRDFNHAIFMQRLKMLRNEHDLTQAQFAEQLGCSKGAVAHWETGGRIPQIDTLIKIANYYNVSLEFLIGTSDFRHEDETINYMLEKLVEVGLVDENSVLKTGVIDRFVGYIEALEKLPKTK